MNNSSRIYGPTQHDLDVDYVVIAHTNTNQYLHKVKLTIQLSRQILLAFIFYLTFVITKLLHGKK